MEFQNNVLELHDNHNIQGLKNILRLKELELPEEWFTLRDLAYRNEFRDKSVMPFIKQKGESKLLTEILDNLRT